MNENERMCDNDSLDSRDSYGREVSPETLDVLKRDIDLLINSLTPTSIDEYDEHTTARRYNASFGDDGYFVGVAGRVIFFGGFPVEMSVDITRGAESDGSDWCSDFLFNYRKIVRGDEPLTIGDAKAAAARSEEIFYFADNAAIDEREKELLEGVRFDGDSSPEGVVLPKLGVTPSGEVYTDGVELSVEKRIGKLSIRGTFSFEDDASLSVFERRMAAQRQAQEEIGRDLTEDRAQKVIAAIDRIYHKNIQSELGI